MNSEPKKDWRISVDGDSKGGWIVEVHDGVRSNTYSPAADTREDAADAARNSHFKAFHAQQSDDQQSAGKGAEMGSKPGDGKLPDAGASAGNALDADSASETAKT